MRFGRKWANSLLKMNAGRHSPYKLFATMYESKPLLITTEQVRELTAFSKNVDDDRLKPSLFYCQDNFVANALGAELYTQILDQVEANNLSPANETLLNGNDRDLSGIRVMLAHYAAWHSVMYVSYAITQKGLVKRFDPNSDTATQDDVNSLRSNMLTNAESYKRNLIAYLDKHTSDYPLYQRSGKRVENSSTGIAGI
jgi:hypothetical protein